MNSFDIFGNPQDSSKLDQDSAYTSPTFHLAPDEMGDAVTDEQVPVRHFYGISFIVLACATLLGIQCFRLQVTQGSQNKALAEGNSVRLITIPADRGLITDDKGVIIAQNTQKLALAVDPLTLPAKRSDRLAIYAKLQKKAGVSDATIALVEKNQTSEYKTPEKLAVKTNLTKDESLLYKEWFNDTPGVLLQEIPIRVYSKMASMGQILGYVGPVTENDVKNGYTIDQRIGKTGIEKEYDTALTGIPGHQKAEVDAFGEVARVLSSSAESSSTPGKTLKLSIDSKLQTIVADALKHELARRTVNIGDLKDMGASAVVIDPNTGEVKAMVSLPDYDDNLFSQGISSDDYNKLLNDPANPLLNRTIQGQYPSGSVIKPLIAAAALQAGIVTPDFQVTTPEAIYVENFRFPDWKVHGQTDIRKAIAESNDIFFYALGGGWKEKKMKGLGIDELNRWLSFYGLGKKTGIDLPGEMGGLLAGPAWKEKNVGEPWYIGDTYHASIGQGYTLTTPLQMAVATAAVANGGTVWQPSVAEATIDPVTNKVTPIPKKVLAKDFVSPENWKVVQEGMRQTVVSGSAQPLKTLTVASAGKTGTAEFGNKGLTHAWYTGYAPYDKPQLAFAILIEAGGDSFYSSIPVAEEILRNYFGDPLKPGQRLNSAPPPKDGI